jgi:methionine-rich copper-binding protein CopC
MIASVLRRIHLPEMHSDRAKFSERLRIHTPWGRLAMQCRSGLDRLLPMGAPGPLALAIAVIACTPAAARPMHVRESLPAAEAIVSGRTAQYVIRFDSWVDHVASRIEITASGRVVETLVPNGESEPDRLVATAPALPPGRYQLHWRARSVPDGEFSEGYIAFTVAR